MIRTSRPSGVGPRTFGAPPHDPGVKTFEHQNLRTSDLRTSDLRTSDVGPWTFGAPPHQNLGPRTFGAPPHDSDVKTFRRWTSDLGPSGLRLMIRTSRPSDVGPRTFEASPHDPDVKTFEHQKSSDLRRWTLDLRGSVPSGVEPRTFGAGTFGIVRPWGLGSMTHSFVSNRPVSDRQSRSKIIGVK